jgi:hypothetical protein
MVSTRAVDRIRPLLEGLLVAARRLEPRYPPLFVVGAPRSGTTLVGLHLANTFELAYFPNVAKRFWRAPYLRTRAALRRGRYAPTYANSFGNVPSELAPSDGFRIWTRWFPPFDEARSATPRQRRELATLIARFERLFDAPFFCKNNANAARIGALVDLFPSARFVHVRRELPETVISLVEARRQHGVELGRWWSAAPPQHLGRPFESELEQAVATVAGIDAYVAAALADSPSERWTRVEYERFCARPDEVVAWVEASYAREGVRLLRRPGERPARFEVSRLDAARRAEVEREIEPWLARYAEAAPSPVAPR